MGQTALARSLVVPLERRILLLRGHRVMMNLDLRRNMRRFPKEFIFRLTAKERAEAAANCGHLEKLKFSSVLPYAFTEHGALMLSSVLNSPAARQASHREVAQKLATMEMKYDAQFKVVFDAIRELMAPPPVPPRPRIGFTRPKGELAATASR
jgi:ORF6N domain-containing protein